MTAPLVPPAINKPRYDLLDGLRGVGAMLVILFHFGEAFASDWTTQMINHGYLAVDFSLFYQVLSSVMLMTRVGITA